MTGRVDSRPVLERLEDLVEAAGFELTHPDIPVARCVCGASLRRHVGAVTMCAGCGLLPSYQDKLHPASGDRARANSAPRERGVPPETSAVPFPARKDDGAPGGFLSAPAGGVLGRAGYALRSLRLGWNWDAVFALVALVGFWALLAAAVVR